MNVNSYDFRKDLEVIHHDFRRDPEAVPASGEVVLTSEWVITAGKSPEKLVRRAAEDLLEYMSVSMKVTLSVAEELPAGCTKEIALVLTDEQKFVPSSYSLTVQEDRIRILAGDPRGIAQGVFYLEDLMNLRSAPFLTPCQDLLREKLFTPRMIHSGMGMDVFSEKYLWNAAHYGYDSILIYLRTLDESSDGKTDFNTLIRQADEAGLDVYFYSSLRNEMHPSEPGAEAFYDSLYGEIFRR